VSERSVFASSETLFVVVVRRQAGCVCVGERHVFALRVCVEKGAFMLLRRACSCLRRLFFVVVVR
jgi:hypothetical protein